MELLEREAPLAFVDAAFKRVCVQEGAVVLVSGEAGVGKTAFVTHFAQTQRGSARVLWGTCDPLFTPRPLGPVYDIAVRDLPALLDLLNSGADWLAIAAALQKMLLESPTPTILVFEDIHWADEASLDLIKYLGRRVQQSKTLLLLTYREDEISANPALRSVLGALPAQNTLRLGLDPLSQEAVAALAAKMNRSAEGVYAATQGNPFFVTEVLRSGSFASTAAGTSTGMIPATVRDAVLARVIHLPAPARALLELVSIIPGQAELWLLENILRPEPAAIDDCIAGGFLLPVVGGSAIEGLVFRHELARLAIEESLAPTRSKELHQKILQAFSKQTSTEIALARLVHHAAHAADAGKVLEYGPRAAEQAGYHGAHREAARYLHTALHYRHELPLEEQAALLDRLSFEYYLTGQVLSSIQVRQEAVELWRRMDRHEQVGDGLRWLSRLFWFQGSKDQADRYASEAISVLEQLPPGKELAMAYSNRSQLHMLAEENEAAVTWGQKALALAEALNETEITIHALTNIGTAELLSEDENGRSKLERALLLAREHEMHDHVARCYANLASQAAQQHRYAAAWRYLSEGLAYTTDRDMDVYSVYLLGWRARWLFEQGRWSESAADTEEVLQLQPGAAVMALPGIITRGHLLARQGNPESRQWLDQARDLAMPTGELQRIGPLAVARAEAAWWSGEAQRVLEELQPAVEIADPGKDRFTRGAVSYWTWRASGELCWKAEIPVAYQAMMTGEWQAAAEQWAQLGCPFEQALALAEGDLEAQRQALMIFDRLGARPAASMLRRKMTECGVKSLSRGARPGTRANPEGLTAREMDILALLEQGLSNAEIAKNLSISSKTVDHHVSAVLAKLQVHSRLEAAALARKKNIL